MKKLTSLFFALLALQSFGQNNWTLSGTHINKNNSGFVGNKFTYYSAYGAIRNLNKIV